MPLHKRLFFLLLVLLPIQLGYHFWPEWTLVLGRRIDYLSPTIYLTDVVIAALLACWFIDVKRRAIFFRAGVLNWVLITILISYVGLNIFFATSRFVALYYWSKVLEFILLGIYIVRTKPQYRKIVVCLSIGLFCSSFIAITQFILQHSIGGPFWLLGERTFTLSTPDIARFTLCKPFIEGCRLILRPYATFPHPNALGGFIAVVIPLLLTESYRKRLTQPKKYFFVFTTIVSTVALVLSFSRSAWAVAGVGIAIVLYRSWSKRNGGRWHYYPLMPIGLILIALIALSVLFHPSVLDESVVVRNDLNVAAILLFQRAPIFGVGLGNYLVRLPDVTKSRQMFFLQPAHNIYLLILSEIGIVGCLLILCLVIWAIRRKMVDMSSPLAGLLLIGLVDHYPITLQQGQLLLTLFVAMSIMKQFRGS